MRKSVIQFEASNQLKGRLQETKRLFGVPKGVLVKNALENFLPTTAIPEDFIDRCGFDLMVKQNVPIRAVLPYTSAMLGYFMDGEFRLKIGSDCVNINPYPEHSILCNIKIIERLYQALKLNGIL